MIVSSTEFQQRVGYYLILAAQGLEIVIEKSKTNRKECAKNNLSI